MIQKRSIKTVPGTNSKFSASYKILLVDDDKLIVDRFERAIHEYGNEYIVEKTTDSRRAIELIEEKQYDLIITDLIMPEIDGIQVLQRAKEIQPDAEVILLTAYSSYNSAIDALYFGAFDYITKPVNLSELKMRIKRAVDKRKALIEKNSKIREMEMLCCTIAHDFKATLISIKAFSEILAKNYYDKLDDEEWQFLINRINANVSTMESISEGLLEYSKIGKINEDWFIINTDKLVREIAGNYSVAFREKKINLTIQTPLPKVYFYNSGLRRVFLNLIDNAVKYARHDTESYIKIGTIPDDSPASEKYIKFFIEDNGIGIEPDNLQLIFEFFHREEKKNRETGFGIGLAVVKKILETANCTIDVESTENEKTVFCFTLPKAAA